MLISEEKLKHVLLGSGVIDEKTWAEVEKNAHRMNASIEDMLKEKDIISGHLFYEIIAKELKVKYANLKKLEIPDSVLGLFSGKIANHYSAIPFEYDKKKNKLKVAFAKSWSKHTIRILQLRTRKKIEPYITSEEGFRSAASYYKKDVAKRLKESIERKTYSAQNTEDFFDSFIEYIYYTRPSDIHIEEFQNSGEVKFRIDGFLKDEFELSTELTSAVIKKIKSLSNTKTDGENQTDGGRFSYDVFDDELSFRVSIIPTYYGEKICLRVLDSDNQKLSLRDLGFSDSDVEMLKKEFAKPYGLIIINGPTGSGKSTTLYSLLKFFNTEGVSIATIEDPVEYPIKHINQSQIDEKGGFTFAVGLRELMRQDPDIVVVGETRDEETAGISVQAALTGHIVISTLHANTAVGAITRLEDMGIEPYLLAPTMNVSISQRLVKKACPYCRESYVPTRSILNQVNKKVGIYDSLNKLKKMGLLSFKDHGDIRFYKTCGCNRCSGKGYSGRIGIFEILNVDKKIQEMILKKKSEKEIQEFAEKKGMLTLFEDGLLKALNGLTTIEEVIERVT